MTTDKPKNLVVHAAGIVGRGFLLGLGFSFALGLAATVGWLVSNHRTASATEEEYGRGDVEKDISLSGVEEVKHDGVTANIGAATNQGKKVAQSVHIQANLFNPDKFFDHYSTYLMGALEPG